MLPLFIVTSVGFGDFRFVYIFAAKYMSHKKRAQRERAAADDFQAAVMAKADASRLHTTADAELFVVDIGCTGVRRRKKATPNVRKAASHNVTPTHRNSPTRRENGESRKRRRNDGRESPLPDDALIDLWGAPPHAAAANRVARVLPAHAKTSTSLPGMSYNPQPRDHHDILASAVAVELRRDEAHVEKDPVWARALSAKSLALAAGEEDKEVTNFLLRIVVAHSFIGQLLPWWRTCTHPPAPPPPLGYG